jgi:hypothetical protein
VAIIAENAIKIEGMKQWLASMQALEVEAPRAIIRKSLNTASELVVQDAKRRAPARSGALRNSIRATATANYARISEGSARVPYAGFIDYGGTVGRLRKQPGRKNTARNATRPFIRTGRILYPAFRAQRDGVIVAMNRELRDAVHSVGLRTDA